MPRYDALLAALRQDADDVRELALTLLRRKRAVYADTLAAIADEHELNPPRVSRAVYRRLRIESFQQAERIVSTYNDELADFLRLAAGEGMTGGEAIDAVQDWTESRAVERADLIAVTEAYGPHVDALVSAYRLADGGPLFDFGGHGDAPPECEVCVAIIEENPHPLERVAAIGVPHPQCRQEWHLNGDVDFAEGVELGLEHAGLLTRDTLVHRTGGRRQAADEIHRLAQT